MKPMNGLFRCFTIVTCLVSLAGRAALAEAPSAKVKPPEPARWLLVVDTSAAMARRGQAVEGVLGELLASGMNGEMKPGDEIGIWTFNKELFAGVAPLQTWEPAKSNLIAGRTVNFLGQQPYRNKSRLSVFLNDLPAVVETSRRLTVVLFSDGSGTVTNTPFDAALNAAYAGQLPVLAKTRMPLITVLRSEHGKFIGHSVTLAPWPVVFPPFAEEPPVAPAAKAEPAKPAGPAREIHISATKPKSEPVPEPVAAAVPVEQPQISPATNPAPAIAAAPVQTNLPDPAPAPVAIAPTVVPPPASAPAPAPEVAAAKPAVTPAAAVEPDNSLARKWPLLVGLGFIVGAVVIALVLVRRARRASSASLITRSFDR